MDEEAQKARQEAVVAVLFDSCGWRLAL